MYPPSQPPPDPGRRFVGMSAGILILVVAGVIALFAVACVGLCAWSAATTETEDDGFESAPSISVTTPAPPAEIETPDAVAEPPAAQTTSTQAPVPPASGETPNPPDVDSAYYSSCADAKRAGAAPLYRGEPGYRKALDRDGDGIACDR